MTQPAGTGPVFVTASGLGEFAYCPKKWALAKQYGKFSREELERQIALLKSTGKGDSPEAVLFERMLSAGARLDAGTAAHTEHAGVARTGRQASNLSWILIAAAVLAAIIAVVLLLRS